MNRDIAVTLWTVSNREREKEFRAWCALSDMTGRENERRAEAHRLKCSQWADAANELYAQINPPIKTGATT